MKVSKYLVFALCASFAGTVFGSTGDYEFRNKIYCAIHTSEETPGVLIKPKKLSEKDLRWFIQKGSDDVIINYSFWSSEDEKNNKVYCQKDTFESTGGKYTENESALVDLALYLYKKGKKQWAANIFANIFAGQHSNFFRKWGYHHSKEYRQLARNVKKNLKNHVVKKIPSDIKTIEATISFSPIKGFPKKITVQGAIEKCFAKCDQY